MNLVLVLAVAFLGYLAWRGARIRLRRAQEALRRDLANQEARGVTLEKDPQTGVYRERRKNG